jgi:HPt (histidine-containing phosphotransfer) domain-containing protein
MIPLSGAPALPSHDLDLEHTQDRSQDAAQFSAQFDAPSMDTPAVNHAGGIARLMGDGALFARVLARFRKEYRETASGIRSALAAGDTALALRLVHTLKGAAGMIEAVPLRQAAHALEQALGGDTGDTGDASGRADAWQCLARLEQALERVLLELDAAAALAAANPAPAAPTRSAPPNAADLAAHARSAQRLAALLDEGNGEAVDLVREAEDALTAQLGEQRYRQLAETIEAFDFDGALALLMQWT